MRTISWIFQCLAMKFYCYFWKAITFGGSHFRNFTSMISVQEAGQHLHALFLGKLIDAHSASLQPGA